VLFRGVEPTGGAASPPLTAAVGPSVRPVPASAWRRSSVPSWLRRYHRTLVGLEFLAAAVAGTVAGFALPTGTAGEGLHRWAGLSLVVLWPAVLAAVGAYSRRLYGTGSEEFRRVGRAGFVLLAVAAIVSYGAALDLSRTLVVVVAPGLTVVSLVIRFAARRHLRRLWSVGRCTKRVVLVGRGGAVLELAARLERERFAGLQPVAACVTPVDRGRVSRAVNLPVGGLDDVLVLAAANSADAVAVTSASETASQYLRTLSWQLEGTGLELLVAPGLVEVAGPRLHLRPFEGLPLLSVEQPRLEGWRRVVKGGMDKVVAAAALVVIAPVLLALALAVRMDTPGPVLFRQERVGVNGRSFTMLKFRSMVVDADQQLEALRADNISDGLLFKLRDDPRVTRVGRWLRRLSLDELPQLVNVLTGSMSLVGPRPPLPSEVAAYDSSVRRRLLVKPGLTGLWQVSGRSDLSWDEAVRLDLRYVENWSLVLDLLILWRTGRAVLRRSGAY
jgi:exopolysaccharide biosynthesis polyprenyl glycosylphosphotransferase